MLNRKPIIITAESQKLESTSSPDLNFKTYSTMTMNDDYLFKILLLGDTGTGKSCLILRYAHDTFTDSPISTIGADFKTKSMEVDGKIVKNDVWDSYGQERFRNIVPNNARGAHAIIISFDLTKRDSFEHVKQWLIESSRYAIQSTNIVLVGTKSDLTDSRAVGSKEVTDFVNNPDNKIEAYVETSSKSGDNVNVLFGITNRLIINRMSPAIAPEKSETELLHQKIIDGLDHYIKRIDGYGAHKFHYFKFPFFKNSRALNRRASYELAKVLSELVKALDPNESDYITKLGELFNGTLSIEERRKNLISNHRIDQEKDFVNRGINSSEINKIIAMAQKATRRKP